MVCVLCVWCIIYAAPPVAKSTTEARPGCATSASKEMLWVMRRVLSSLTLPLNFFLISLSAVPTALCCYLGDQPTSWAHPTVLHHWIPATGNACTATTVYITVLQTLFPRSSFPLPCWSPSFLHSFSLSSPHTLSFSVQVLPPPSSSLLWIPARMKKTFKLSRYHPDGSNHWKCIVCLSILLTVVYSKLKHLYKYCVLVQV